jgi:hypothetical protein
MRQASLAILICEGFFSNRSEPSFHIDNSLHRFTKPSIFISCNPDSSSPLSEVFSLGTLWARLKYKKIQKMDPILTKI